MAEMPDFISDGPVGGQFNVNLYYEPDTIYGVPALISAPGLELGVDAGTGQIRGMLSYKNILYIVVGNDLVCWTGSGAVTTLSTDTFDTSTGPVTMAVNGANEIVMTDHTTAKLFTWTITNTTTGAGTWSVPVPATVNSIVPAFLTYQDTFFIMGDSASRSIYCSGVDDATTWSTLDVSTKMGAPDLIRSGISAGNGILWIFGTDTTEPWYYTQAASGLPFSRVGQGILNVGCWAARSVTRIGNAIYWLNNHGEVCRTVGYDHEVISPPQMNDEIQYYAQTAETYVTGAIGMYVTWEGHPWYILQFPTYNRTWCYDLAAAAAGQKGWFRLSTGSGLSRHKANCSAYFAGKWYVGDFNTTGYVFQLKDEHYADYDDTRYYTKYTKYMSIPGKRVIFNEFKLRSVYSDTWTTAYTNNTTLTADAAVGATTITVASTTGISNGKSLKIYMNTGIHACQVVGAPAASVVTFSPALTVAANSGKNVYVGEAYALYPRTKLTATGVTAKTIYQTTHPGLNNPSWASLGSGYETLLTLEYIGVGQVILLGADLRVAGCSR